MGCYQVKKSLKVGERSVSGSGLEGTFLCNRLNGWGERFIWIYLRNYVGLTSICILVHCIKITII